MITPFTARLPSIHMYYTECKWSYNVDSVCGGSVWVMGEWAVRQWIVGDMRFQKIFGLCSVEYHKVEKWSCKMGSGPESGFFVYGESVCPPLH